MTTDLEARVAEGLHGVGDRSPDPPDLAAGARARLARRRRTTAGVVAALLAVVAVPLGLALVDGQPERERSTDGVPEDWRVETFGDLTVRVPPTWRSDARSTDWCADGVTRPEPRVTRPGPVQEVECTPRYPVGVHFGPGGLGPLPPGTEGVVQQYTGSRFPDGAWIGFVGTGAASLWVVAEDRVIARRVLDTATVVRRLDPNGCTVRADGALASNAERVSVCRYESGLLQQSELLSAEDSAAATAAVRATEAPGPAARVACPPSSERVARITLQSAVLDARLLPSRACGLSAVFLERGEQRLLTAEVLRWALSPGSPGALPRGLPAPDRLRTR